MDLYIQPLSLPFEKNAAEVALPENANIWPNEIMQELYKQVPFISDFEANVVMDRVDAERGYGFGHVEVQNKTEMQVNADPKALQAIGIQQVRVPVIIKDRKLQPFDVLITADSKALPLTEGRMRQALFRPQAFDVTSRTPGDQSMVGQLYPPYRQNYGFGGGGVGMSVGMGKEGSALEEFLEKEALSKELLARAREEAKKKGRQLAYLKPILDRAAEEDPTGAVFDARPGRIKRLTPIENKTDYAKHTAKRLQATEELQRRIERAEARKDRVPPQAPPPQASSKTPPQAPPKQLTPLTRGKQVAIGLGAAGGVAGSALLAKHIADKKFQDYRHPQEEKQAAIPNSTQPEPARTKIKDIVPHVKKGSVLLAISSTINEDDYLKFASALEEPSLQAAFVKNAAATSKSLAILSNIEPVSLRKTASIIEDLVQPTVAQIAKAPQGYVIKTASHICWSPREVLADRGQVVRSFGEKIALAVDQSGSMTLATGEGVKDSSPESKPELITSFGVYRVKDDAGQELVGFVFPNLIDVDGTVLPVAAFTNGSVSAVQSSIVGELVGKDAGLVFGPVKGQGMFVRTLPNGSVDAMVPMSLRGGYSEGPAKRFHVETFDGKQVFVEVQPNIKNPTMVDDVCLVPDTFRWMPLNGDEVSLAESVEDWGATKQASRALASVLIRASGENSVSLSGIPLNKLAYEDTNFLSTDGALFVLGGLGTDLKHASEKIAQSILLNQPVEVRVGRSIKLASDVKREATLAAHDKLAKVPNLRRNLLKEAAFIPDPMAVDTVLSIGFINPENAMTFVSYLPQIDQAQERLCNLLIAARLGLSDVPTSPLEKTVKSLEEVIEGLKVLAFQK